MSAPLGDVMPQDEDYDSGLAARQSITGALAPRRKPESEVVSDAIALIKGKAYHGYARKVHGGAMSQTGEPDLDVCVRGRAIKLEAKAIGGRPTGPQMVSMRRWSRAGALVGWFRTNAHVVAILDHLDDPGFVPDLSMPGCSCPRHAQGGESS
jgi:hypothetical protein